MVYHLNKNYLIIPFVSATKAVKVQRGSIIFCKQYHKSFQEISYWLCYSKWEPYV